MAKSVQLSNGKFWSTQTAAKAHFKAILNALSDGERVTHPSDHGDLVALLQEYDRDIPEGTTKAGQGIVYFFRDRDKEHNGLTSCFYVYRTDGTSIDFSYIRAIEVTSRRGK
ncbi:DCL family protein [Massilia sp. YIM B04103]|uniref:DCL family protein n=1 Tax=Massilia sp. YIM B04103 TaxID=2963106 RepID=UPI00210B98B6|nr:DCL family protein [Massilia sp. YIM B04103]